MTILPSSIPSPDYSWQVFYFGTWLHDIGLTWVTIPIPIHAYALCIMTGIVAAALVAGYRLKLRGADAGVVLDIALWNVPFGIIGGRIFHVITHPDDYFGAGKDLMKIFYIWEGGLAIFGALMLGAVGTFIGCRLSGVRFTSFVDAVAPGLLLAQAFGRLGNYFNHELYGLPTNLPWGLEIESTNPAFPAGLPAGTLFHPTFLYEIIWNLIGVAVLIYVERRWHLVKKTIPFLDVVVRAPHAGAYRLQWGKMLGMYLIWYGIGRSFFESIRIDPSEIFFGIRTNVWASFGAILVGIIIIVVQSRRHPGMEPSAYLPGREWSTDDAVHTEDVYTDADFNGPEVKALTSESESESVSEKTGTALKSRKS